MRLGPTSCSASCAMSLRRSSAVRWQRRWLRRATTAAWRNSSPEKPERSARAGNVCCAATATSSNGAATSWDASASGVETTAAAGTSLFFAAHSERPSEGAYWEATVERSSRLQQWFLRTSRLVWSFIEREVTDDEIAALARVFPPLRGQGRSCGGRGCLDGLCGLSGQKTLRIIFSLIIA
jgi:hypothetical protein